MSTLRMFRHEPTDECEAVHCHAHEVDEVGRGYLVCGECGHTFTTARDLLRDYNASAHKLALHSARVVDDVTHCPHCGSDF